MNTQKTYLENIRYIEMAANLVRRGEAANVIEAFMIIDDRAAEKAIQNRISEIFKRSYDIGAYKDEVYTRQLVNRSSKVTVHDDIPISKWVRSTIKYMTSNKRIPLLKEAIY